MHDLIACWSALWETLRRATSPRWIVSLMAALAKLCDFKTLRRFAHRGPSPAPIDALHAPRSRCSCGVGYPARLLAERGVSSPYIPEALEIDAPIVRAH